MTVREAFAAAKNISGPWDEVSDEVRRFRMSDWDHLTHEQKMIRVAGQALISAQMMREAAGPHAVIRHAQSAGNAQRRLWRLEAAQENLSRER